MGIFAVFLRNAVEQPDPEVGILTEMFAHGLIEYDKLDAGHCFTIDGTQYHFTGKTQTIDYTDVAYFAPLTVPVDVSNSICRCMENLEPDNFDFTKMLKKDLRK